MQKMFQYLLDFFLVVVSFLFIMPQELLGTFITNEIANTAQDKDTIAGGHMGGGRSHSRRGGSAVKRTSVRQRGSVHINRGGGRGINAPPPSIYFHPSSPEDNEEIPTDEIPTEEEPQFPIHELPDFNLSIDTPIIHPGDRAILKVSDVQASEPISIFWRWGDDEWQVGDITFQKTATQTGIIPVSVVIQDAEGLYSQMQTIELDVQSVEPSTSPQAKPYYEMAPEDNENIPETPSTDDQTTIDIFLQPLTEKHRARLKGELEKSYTDLHQWERYVEADKRIRDNCEVKLTKILLNRPIGEETPSKEEQEYSDCLTRVNQKLKNAQKEIDKLKANINKLNSVLK